MDIRDGSNGSGIEILHQILTNGVVGIILLGTGILDGGLDLKIGHEGRAGDDDHAPIRLPLTGHHQQAVVIFGIGILGGAITTQPVFVHVHGIGGGVAEHHRAHGLRESINWVAGGVHRIDGGAAVVAEDLGIHPVEGVVCIKFDVFRQKVLPVVAGEVEPPFVHAVGGAADVVIRGVVADAQAGTQRRQQLVLRRGHVLDIRIALDHVIVLIVVRPTGQNHHAARLVEGPDGDQLGRRVGPGVALCIGQTTGGGGKDQRLVFFVGAGGDQLLAGLELHRPHTVARGQVAEVAHGVLIIACHILVVVGGVDADIHQLGGVQHVQRHVHGVFIFHTLLLHQDRHGDGHDLGHGGSIPERDLQRPRGGDCVTGGVHAQGLAAAGVGHRLNGGVRALAVEQSGGDGQLLVGNGGGGAAHHAGDTQLQGLAHPDRRGDRHIPVALGDADVVIAVCGVQGAAQQAGGQLSGVIPGVGHPAGVDDDLDLGDRVRPVGIGDLNAEAQLFWDFLKDGAQRLLVDRVVDLQVFVLRGIHPVAADGLVDALFAEVVGEDDVPRVIGVAPLALVVVLVIGGGHMPALIQRHGVILIAGVIAAGADGALAVAHLHHIHPAVNEGIPVREVGEGTESGARMVELGQGVHALRLTQQGVIGLQARVVGLVVQGRVVPGHDTRGIEGVDVAGAAGPGHLKAAQSDLAVVLGVEGVDGRLVGIPGLLAVCGGLAHIVEGPFRIGRAGLVKIVGVVGEGHKVHIGAVRQVGHIAQGGLQRAGAVGVLGVGVELAEVEPLGGLPHREAPGLSGGLPVRAGDRNRGGIPPVCQVGLRDVNRLAAVHCHDRLIQRRTAGLQGQHSDRGLSPVAELRRNNGPFLCPGLRAGRRRHRSDDGFVFDGDASSPGNGRALGVLTGHGDGDALAVDCVHGNGIGAVPVGGEYGLPRLHGEPGLRHAEHRVHGEGKGIRLAHIGVRQGPKHDLGEIDHAVGHLHAVRHRVELERIDVLVGDVVHAVGLVGSGIVFQVLAVLAVKLGRPALQRKAAIVLRQRPVGVLRSLLLVESVVAGAVGTEVAVMGRLETVVVSVLLYREDPSAIGRRSFSVRDLSRGAGDGGALRIVILPGQHALGGVVIQHHLIAGSRERAAGRSLVGELVKIEPIVIGILLTKGGEQSLIDLHGLSTAIVDGLDADDVPPTCDRLQCPKTIVRGVILKGQTIAGRTCRQILSFLIGKGIIIVSILGSSEHRHSSSYCHKISLRSRCGASELIAVRGVVHDQSTRIVVNYKLVAVGNGISQLGVADLFDLRCLGITKLQCSVIYADSSGNIHHIAHLDTPRSIRLSGDGLINLNAVPLAICYSNVGARISTVVVINLGDLYAGQPHISADIRSRQFSNRHVFGAQSQASGLFISSRGQFRQPLKTGP